MIKILKEVIHNNYSSVQKPRKVSLIFKLFYNYSNKNILSLMIIRIIYNNDLEYKYYELHKMMTFYDIDVCIIITIPLKYL